MQKRIGFFILVMLLTLVIAERSHAEIEGIRLEVDGLSCPFCAIGIHKQLKQTGSLEEIEVHLKQGVTEAKLPFGKGIDVGKIRRAVQEAGFTLRGIKLTVIGQVIHDKGHLTIKSRGDGTQFLLFDSEHREADSETFLKGTLQQKLEKVKQTGKVVRMSGSVHEHQGLPPALMIESFEALPE